MYRKNSFRMIMLALMLLISIVGITVCASASSYDYEQELIQLPDFKFWNHDKNGIGYGLCPVYTAPYKNAYRCADGKASCQTNAQMSDAGIYGGWLLVRYETNNGGCRVGYIPPEYIRGYESPMNNRRFEHRVPATATGTINVTDNPFMRNSLFTTLYPGDQFYVLAKYTYFQQKGLDWWYIECYVDGQVARGFIDRPSSSFNVGDDPVSKPNPGPNPQPTGIPNISDIGTTYMFNVRIESPNRGTRVIVRKNADPNTAQVTVVYPGNEYPCYAEKQGTTGKIWYYIWVDEGSHWGWVSSGHATKVR